MSISIHELLAVARESEGVKAVKGDDILCEKRFAPDTRYMVEFLMLEQTEWFGEREKSVQPGRIKLYFDIAGRRYGWKNWIV